MPGQAMILAPAGLLLAGAICLAWSTTATGPSRRRRLIATEALWAVAGLLALSTVAVTVYHLCTEPIGRSTIGNSIAVVFIGTTSAFAVVGLLGYVGLWARLRRRGRPAPIVAVRRETGDGGEWARVVDELSAARVIDLAYPTASMDPLQLNDNREEGRHGR